MYKKQRKTDRDKAQGNDIFSHAHRGDLVSGTEIDENKENYVQRAGSKNIFCKVDNRRCRNAPVHGIEQKEHYDFHGKGNDGGAQGNHSVKLQPAAVDFLIFLLNL